MSGVVKTILLSITSLIALSLLILASGLLARGSSAEAGVVQDTIALMAVDVDTTGNTATALGSLESTRVVSPNDVFDIDVIVDDIPATRPMSGFDFEINYDPAVVTITDVDDALLLAANAGSGPLFTFTDAVPDNDGNFKVAVADFSLTDPGETGPGVLARITIEINGGAPSGVSTLALDVTEVVDNDITDIPRDQELGASLDVQGGAPPTPTPTPTSTPPPATPTPTPSPGATTPTPTATPTATPTQTPVPQPDTLPPTGSSPEAGGSGLGTPALLALVLAAAAGLPVTYLAWRVRRRLL